MLILDNNSRFSYKELYTIYDEEFRKAKLLPLYMNDIVIIDTFYNKDFYDEIVIEVIRANVPYLDFHHDGDQHLVFINKIIHFLK